MVTNVIVRIGANVALNMTLDFNSVATVKGSTSVCW